MSFQKRDLTECELQQMLDLQDYKQLSALFKLYNTMKVISECQRTQIEDRLKELDPPLGRNGRCGGGSYRGLTGKRSRATRRNGNLRKRRSRKGRRTSRKGKL